MVSGRDTLYDLLLRAAETAGTVQAIADAMDMSLSALIRGAKSASMSTDACLRLSEVIGVDPSLVLSLVGKADTAKRIERLYGKPRGPLTADDRALLALHPAAKAHLRRLVDGLRS